MKSDLATLTILTDKHSGKRTKSIDRITPHCFVGQVSARRIGEFFRDTDRKCSCNYGIGNDGKIVCCVDEENRSWCSSSAPNDQRAITIECACDPHYPYIFDYDVYLNLVDLCADICKRYGKKKLLWLKDKETTLNYKPKEDEMVLSIHRWFSKKECPGEWLYQRLGMLANDVTYKLQDYLIHTVERGETLWSIARKYYGKGQDYLRIMNFNYLKTNKIKKGQQLKIPL